MPGKHNFQVERFDDKDKRDARHQELKDRGRQGLLKLSVGEWTTIKDLARRPGDGKLVSVEREITVPVWAVAYPREIPGKKRRRSRTFPARPLQSKRVKRSRYLRRHPVKPGNFREQHWITGRPLA